MNKLNEVTKFKIITEIKEQSEKFHQMTAPEICDWIKEHHDVNVVATTIYRWAKLYEFSYKPQRKKPKLAMTHSEAHCINQRIRTLGIVIRNLCKELDIKHPSILDKLLFMRRVWMMY